MGLLFFDPLSHETHMVRYPNQGASVYVTSLLEQGGNLWVATRKDGMFRYNLASGKIDFDKDFNKGWVNDMIYDKDGDLLVCHNGKVMRRDKSTGNVEQLWKSPTNIPDKVLNLHSLHGKLYLECGHVFYRLYESPSADPYHQWFPW